MVAGGGSALDPPCPLQEGPLAPADGPPQVPMEDPPTPPNGPPTPIDVGYSSLGLPFDPSGSVDELAAEIHVEHGQVQVTVALPTMDPADVRYFVGSNIVLVWSHTDPDNVRTLVRLPMDVVPDTSIVRLTNGVFDITVLAADPTTANPGANEPPNLKTREGSA